MTTTDGTNPLGDNGSSTSLDADLIRSATAMAAQGWTIAMTRITLNDKGKKTPLGLTKGWENGPSPTVAEITAAVTNGANGYLYRLPGNVFVVDTDTSERTAEFTQILGTPDVVTPRGAHWLVDGQLDPKSFGSVDTEPRQLYGPGSHYVDAQSVTVRYASGGDMLPSPWSTRHLPDDLPRKPSTKANVHTGRSAEPVLNGGFFGPPALTRAQAIEAARSKLTAIATSTTHGSAARGEVRDAAFFLGGLLHTGWFSYDEAWSQVEAACAKRWGAADADDQAWIEQGLRDGELKPMPVRNGGDLSSAPEGSPLADLAGAPDVATESGDAPSEFDRAFAQEAEREYWRLRVRAEAKERFDRERYGPAVEFEALTFDELESLPQAEPLISGLLFRESFALMPGQFGTYKTFAALGMAFAVATGAVWGPYSAPQALPVLYVAAEGANGIRKRLTALAERHGCRVPETLRVVPKVVDLGSDAAVEELGRIAEKMGAALVIVDTLHQCTPGLDENSNADMGAVLGRLRRHIIERCGATVAATHHTGHEANRARGASSLEDDADTVLVFRLKGGNESNRSAHIPRELVVRKSKDGESGAVVKLVATPVAGSLVVAPPAGARDGSEIFADAREVETDALAKRLYDAMHERELDPSKNVDRVFWPSLRADFPSATQDLVREVARVYKHTHGVSVELRPRESGWALRWGVGGGHAGPP